MAGLKTVSLMGYGFFLTCFLLMLYGMVQNQLVPMSLYIIFPFWLSYLRYCNIGESCQEFLIGLM